MLAPERPATRDPSPAQPHHRESMRWPHGSSITGKRAKTSVEARGDFEELGKTFTAPLGAPAALSSAGLASRGTPESTCTLAPDRILCDVTERGSIAASGRQAASTGPPVRVGAMREDQ